MQNKKPGNTQMASIRYLFIAEHRGGPLSAENHRLLMLWACACSARVLPLFSPHPDISLCGALELAEKWRYGQATTGDAMKASAKLHALARAQQNMVNMAVARSVGHAVATAHMADHALGAAFYALKALKYADSEFDSQRHLMWNHLAALSPGLLEIVQQMWSQKQMDKRI